MLENIYIVDVNYIKSMVDGNVYDERLRYIGKMDYSSKFANTAAQYWFKYINYYYGNSARLLALDLDNTLWGGVLGEDGITGLQVGGDYPGSPFYEFQGHLLSLKNKGYLLAIVSKNDEDLVKKAFSTLVDMPLKLEDFFSVKCSWKEKSSSLLEISNDLNLSLSSFLFIDDNPAERLAVKERIPAVKILELPLDPTLYLDALISSPFVAEINPSEQDLNRMISYSQMAEIKRLSTSNPSRVSDYLMSLNIKVGFDELSDSNLSRAEQLSLKTNQFNTTTRRYQAMQLKKIADEGGAVFVIRSSSSQQEPENIGLLVLMIHNTDSCLIIDNMLLSCRSMGRLIESAALTFILNYAKKSDLKLVKGLFEKSERNHPCQDVFINYGFTEVSRDNGF